MKRKACAQPKEVSRSGGVPPKALKRFGGEPPKALKRRALIAAGAGLLLPRKLLAQPTTGLRRLGALMGGLPDDPEMRRFATTLVQALEAHGWHEGANLHIDWRWQGRDPGLFERDVGELVARAPDVIFAMASPAVRALQSRTKTIPIVFALVTDAVGQHLVESLTRPGGNITGFSDYDASMAGKWVQLLTQINPAATSVAAIFNPAAAPFADLLLNSITVSARTSGISLHVAPVKDEADIRTTMSVLARERHGGAIVLPDAFSFLHRKAFIDLATEFRLPVVYWNRLFVDEGGLMSYGSDNVDQLRRSAEYIDRILKGASPADLPVQLPTKFELAVNLKTAKDDGVTIPPILLATADDVIE